MSGQSSEFRARLERQLKEWSLPEYLADEIADHLTPVTYEKGAVIFLRGSPADFMFCLLNGFAKLYLPRMNGQRTLIALARAGDLLGFVDSLNADNRRGQVFEAHALTKCSVGLISRDYLIKLLCTLDSASSTRLLEYVNTTWSQMFEWYATFMGLSFRERLQLVLENLKVRAGAHDQRGVLLLPAITHEDLAEMIGSSRPMVSRLISDMTEDGLLERREKQHYVVRSNSWSARADLFNLNTRRPVPVSCATGGSALPTNDGSKSTAAAMNSVSAVSLNERQSQRSTRARA